MEKTLTKLTAKKFQDIYANEKFRNEVATAHGCYDSNMVFKHKATCSYPDTYIVTDEQIMLAKRERRKAKAKTIKQNEGKLMFVGMGMTYEARYENDVCNHRIRTEFVNARGHRYFIELGTGNGETMRIDHSIDRDKQDQLKDDIRKQSQFFNFNGLERKDHLPKYTKANVLELVNQNFGCKFKEIIIDNHNVSTDDYTSVSPR